MIIKIWKYLKVNDMYIIFNIILILINIFVYILDNMKAVNPFIKRIPESLHNSFMDDLINAVTTLNLKQNHNLNELDSNFNMPYKLMVAYARKSS